ncbi:hypothetical protein D3C86_1848180 [compost metagenome]
MACLNPSPIFPRRFSLGTRQLSKIISVVSEARIPNLFSFLPAEKPGVPRSTTIAEIPFELPFSPVRTITTAISPDLP